jgi:hypothetical protein
MNKKHIKNKKPNRNKLHAFENCYKVKYNLFIFHRQIISETPLEQVKIYFIEDFLQKLSINCLSLNKIEN